MKKKTLLLIYSLAIMSVFLMFTNSCKKEDDKTPTPDSGIIFNPDLSYGKVTDIEGNSYKTITIGAQTWMAENLRVTKYCNGDPIPNVTDKLVWSNLTTMAYCVYENTESNSSTYGKLYNWYAVSDSRNIAPDGWHVPADSDWTILTTFLGGESVAGGKLKEIGFVHWADTNAGATNKSGFTALPGGGRGSDGAFSGIHSYGYWWSSTKCNSNNTAYGRHLGSLISSVHRYIGNDEVGYSVRCIKDK